MLIQHRMMEQEDMDAGYESLPVHDARILRKVDCIGVERRNKPTKHHVYVLVVCWSDGVKYPIYRRYISFFDLKVCLKEEFKTHPKFEEPELPALKHFERGWLFGSKDSAMDKRKKYINAFCGQVLKLPEEIVRSSSVESFYDAWESDFDQDNHNTKHVLGKSPNQGRKLSVPVMEVPHELNTDCLSTNEDATFARYKDRSITDLNEKPVRKPRAISMVLNPDAWPSGGFAAHIGRCSPRGVKTARDNIPDQSYRATCDYERRRPGEMNLHSGHLVEVLEKSISGWWFVHVEGSDGQTEQGWAPGAFLDRVHTSSPAKLEKSSSLSTPPPPYNQDDLCGIYETICDFRATEEDEVSYAKGQKVEVISAEPDGWWKIRTESESEGFTPAMNLKNTDKRAKPAEEESQFRNKSLRGRGPPPRRSGKGKEARIEESSTSDMDIAPLYSEIMKPKKGENGVQGSSIQTSLTSGRSLPVTQTKTLNYTEVVFSAKQDDDQGKQEAPRVRRHNRVPVEYAEINPRPLPAMPANANKAQKSSTQPTRNYQGQFQQQQQPADQQVHQPKPHPPQLYENVDSEDFRIPRSSSFGENQTGTRPLQQNHRVDPDPNVSGGRLSPAKDTTTTTATHTTTTHTTTISSSPRTSPGITPQSQEKQRVHPVPKPRKPQRTPAIRNSNEIGGGGRKAVTRPQEPLPAQHRLQESPPPPESAQVKLQTFPRAKGQENVKPPRLNYENASVSLVNDLILSHNTSGSPIVDSLKSTTPEAKVQNFLYGSDVTSYGKDKMASNPMFADAKSMNPVLNDYILQLPSAPSQTAPGLPPEAAIWWSKIPELGESNMIEAIWDYDAPAGLQAVLSFKKSELGVKINRENNGWIGVKMGEKVGWVPVLYWGTHVPNPNPAKRGIRNIKQAEVLHENKAWFLGKMTRQESEDLLVHHGKHRDFMIRESTNRVGDLTLSVKDKDRIRHFPIQMTPNGKYDIGKAHFADLTKVVSYYQEHPLFFDDQNNNEPVSLGKPINRPKSP